MADDLFELDDKRRLELGLATRERIVDRKSTRLNSSH